jgi:cytochrome c peroxidase
MNATRLLIFLPLAISTASCGSVTPADSAVASSPDEASSDRPASAPRPHSKPPTRQGATIARSPTLPLLYVADEDHAALRRVPLPVDVQTPPTTVPLPGRPAQVLALADCVLVTIRDPGLLVVFAEDPSGLLVERTRIALPDDAWGIAVTADEATAVVTSAWTHAVSAIDLRTAKLRWTVEVAREPRGIAIREDGAAYVSHLVGTSITRLDGLDGDAPGVTKLALPAAPLRARWADVANVGASLGYAAVLSPDDTRLFVARQALGALGPAAWYGVGTVDVMVTKTDSPLSPQRTAPGLAVAGEGSSSGELFDPAGPLPTTSVAPFVQPRAMVYRQSTDTLLVAGEGDDVLSEFDARAIAPALHALRTYPVGGRVETPIHVAAACSAPSGIALSDDEATAYVFCRASYDIAIVRLDGFDVVDRFEPGPIPSVRIAEDAEAEPLALGRRLFYNARDAVTSGGFACAGCHPEGRDDGFVWHEVMKDDGEGEKPIFVGSRFALSGSQGAPDVEPPKGVARQTPMLAGRVGAPGPYGWHAESATLSDRLKAGFRLHRWFTWEGPSDEKSKRTRADAITAFLREGLPPPRHERPLTEIEQQGKVLFSSDRTQCAGCHVPETAYTDRNAVPLPMLAPPPGFDQDPNPAFKVPSLLYVGGTAPYFHDGHARSLEELVDKNGDRMGKTNQLTADERAALVAFLRTL